MRFVCVCLRKKIRSFFHRWYTHHLKKDLFVRTDFLGDIHQRARQQITDHNKCVCMIGMLSCVSEYKWVCKMFIECRIEGTTMNREREVRAGWGRMEFVWMINCFYSSLYVFVLHSICVSLTPFILHTFFHPFHLCSLKPPLSTISSCIHGEYYIWRYIGRFDYRGHTRNIDQITSSR